MSLLLKSIFLEYIFLSFGIELISPCYCVVFLQCSRRMDPVFISLCLFIGELRPSILRDTVTSDCCFLFFCCCCCVQFASPLLISWFEITQVMSFLGFRLAKFSPMIFLKILTMPLTRVSSPSCIHITLGFPGFFWPGFFVFIHFLLSCFQGLGVSSIFCILLVRLASF